VEQGTTVVSLIILPRSELSECGAMYGHCLRVGPPAARRADLSPRGALQRADRENREVCDLLGGGGEPAVALVEVFILSCS